MKKLTLLLCCFMSVSTMQAGKNKKSDAPAKTLASAKEDADVQNHVRDSAQSYWIQDKRLGRHGYIVPDSADIAKYGI